MTWLLILAIAVFGVVLVMALVGALLPRDHVATRSATYARPPDVVWRGVLELSAQSTLPLEVVADEPPRRRVTRITDPKLPFGGSWTYELAPDNGVTRLTITEDGFVTNVVFRFLSRFVFGHATGIEKFLRELATRLAAS